MKTEQQQIALVTGSSSGIGFETSLLLARNGIRTYATMRNLSKSTEILSCAKKENLPLVILGLDVTKERSISEVIEQIIDEKGRVDILVNNHNQEPELFNDLVVLPFSYCCCLIFQVSTLRLSHCDKE